MVGQIGRQFDIRQINRIIKGNWLLGLVEVVSFYGGKRQGFYLSILLLVHSRYPQPIVVFIIGDTSHVINIIQG